MAAAAEMETEMGGEAQRFAGAVSDSRRMHPACLRGLPDSSPTRSPRANNCWRCFRIQSNTCFFTNSTIITSLNF